MSTAAKFCEAIGKCHGRRTRKRFWAFVFLMKEERQKEVARDWCAIGEEGEWSTSQKKRTSVKGGRRLVTRLVSKK